MAKSKKKILGLIKLQIPAGKANPSPPVGPALGQKGLNIMEFCKAFNAQTQKIEMDVKVGEKVRITSGPFAEFVGDITEVYPDKAKLRAMVSIFGRETPVELEYKQIQKL